MRRRNATAAGNSARASSRKPCSPNMPDIFPVFCRGTMQKAPSRRQLPRPVGSLPLQCPHHPPASDVSPITVGCDDHRPIENEFARIDAPTALLGDPPQSVVVRGPAWLPTGFLDRIEKTDVWRMRLDRAGDLSQVLAKALQIRGRLDIDDDGSHRCGCRI